MTLEMTYPQINPLPAGFTLRPGRLEDYKLVFDLANASALKLLGTLDLTDPEVIRNDWQDPKFDIAKSTRLAFAPDGTLAGALEVWDTDNPPVHPWIWFCVHPDYAESGVAEALLDWAEARAAEAESRVPVGSASRRAPASRFRTPPSRRWSNRADSSTTARSTAWKRPSTARPKSRRCPQTSSSAPTTRRPSWKRSCAR